MAPEPKYGTHNDAQIPVRKSQWRPTGARGLKKEQECKNGRRMGNQGELPISGESVSIPGRGRYRTMYKTIN